MRLFDRKQHEIFLRPICSHLFLWRCVELAEQQRQCAHTVLREKKEEKFVDSSCTRIILLDMSRLEMQFLLREPTCSFDVKTQFPHCLCLPDAAAPSQTQKRTFCKHLQIIFDIVSNFKGNPKTFQKKTGKGEIVLEMRNYKATRDIWTCKNTPRLTQHDYHFSNWPIWSLWNGWQLLSTMWNIGFSHFR